MIVGSSNVRGFGGSIKKRNMRNLVRDLHSDFLAIQEVKLMEGDGILCSSLWSNTACG